MARRESASDTVANAMTGLPATKAALTWTQRKRATSTDVQRYSRFVVIMKRALPMAAAVLLAAVIAYSLQPRQQDSKRMAITFRTLGIDNNDLTMVKPKLTGIDSGGNPFVVTADRAIQDPHDSRRALLEHVEADLTLKNGTWLNATATHGRLNASMTGSGAGAGGHAKQTQKLAVYGAVDVYSDNGYEVHTTSADIDTASGIIVGNHMVNGHGPLGEFRADRFKIDRDAKLVYLYGNIRMTLYLHGKKF